MENFTAFSAYKSKKIDNFGPKLPEITKSNIKIDSESCVLALNFLSESLLDKIILKNEIKHQNDSFLEKT